MGIQLDIFSLHQFWKKDMSCEHLLLLKVAQRSFNNADENDYAAAIDSADKKRKSLIRIYKAEILAGECAGEHLVNLAGELQSYPVGNELFDRYGRFFVNLWTASTRFGHPWIVMGIAENEEMFWRKVNQDEDLFRLGGIRPANQRRAYFLTENELNQSDR
jgi:hypothetical protein